ncbi:hypothetical protein M0L20_28585 [Spirosoma sp. RP8]|uniref:DUF5077 domain-containing protein n=1 Tax=Spirosoma liriopis TaxID=2937440 RepID=A0ABT0HUI5_9BACT|nr:hypothetical protein [Spirosoma liriopis]MCK8495857.1 hypothetical protein [Spirosoma liriopis]
MNGFQIRVALLVLVACISWRCDPVDESTFPDNNSYFPGLDFEPVNDGQFPVWLANSIDAEPQDMTIEVWYYDVTDNSDEALADVRNAAYAADDEFVVQAKGNGFSNYNVQKQVQLYFDEAALVVLRIKTNDGQTAYAAFTTTNSKNQVVTFSAQNGGRLAASTNARICFEYLNNETEVFRPAYYMVKVWRSDNEPSGNPTGKPTYIVTKPANGRSFARKSVRPGWYTAEFDGSGHYQKFSVSASENGLLVYNEHNWSSPFSGYSSSYGKVRVSWAKPPGQDATAVLTFFKAGAHYTNIWMYAEDGSGKIKYQFWFMPSGVYELNYNLHNSDNYATKSVPVHIAPGKVYPNIKLTY